MKFPSPFETRGVLADVTEAPPRHIQVPIHGNRTAAVPISIPGGATIVNIKFGLHGLF